MAPVWTIVVFAALGFLFKGFAGLIGGVALGLVVTFALGGAVQLFQGGPVPRKVRHQLAANMVANHTSVVEKAFPGKQGPELYSAVEEQINRLVRKAISIAPSNAAVFDKATIMLALAGIAAEEPDPGIRDFYAHLTDQIASDWY